MLFSLYKQDYNKKEGTPSWQEPVPSFIKYIPKEVSKYYDTHFQSVLQAEKIKNKETGDMTSMTGTGRLIHEFKISESGTYSAFVENKNNFSIKVTGTAMY